MAFTKNGPANDILPRGLPKDPQEIVTAQVRLLALEKVLNGAMGQMCRMAPEPADEVLPGGEGIFDTLSRLEQLASQLEAKALALANHIGAL